MLAEFPEDEVQIWKIQPGDNPTLEALFRPFIQRANTDACYVAPKQEVEAAIAQFGRIISS